MPDITGLYILMNFGIRLQNKLRILYKASYHIVCMYELGQSLLFDKDRSLHTHTRMKGN